MSRKQIRKVHIDDKEYVYVIKKGYPDGTFVNVYESGNKSDAFCQLEYPEYTKVTPSMVKGGIRIRKGEGWCRGDGLGLQRKMSECKVCESKGYHKLSCPNNDKKPIKISVDIKPNQNKDE